MGAIFILNTEEQDAGILCLSRKRGVSGVELGSKKTAVLTGNPNAPLRSLCDIKELSAAAEFWRCSV